MGSEMCIRDRAHTDPHPQHEDGDLRVPDHGIRVCGRGILALRGRRRRLPGSGTHTATTERKHILPTMARPTGLFVLASGSSMARRRPHPSISDEDSSSTTSNKSTSTGRSSFQPHSHRPTDRSMGPHASKHIGPQLALRLAQNRIPQPRPGLDASEPRIYAQRRLQGQSRAEVFPARAYASADYRGHGCCCCVCCVCWFFRRRIGLGVWIRNAALRGLSLHQRRPQRLQWRWSGRELQSLRRVLRAGNGEAGALAGEGGRGLGRRAVCQPGEGWWWWRGEVYV